ncbi:MULTISPECIES: glycosyltransferase family A protein [unclassified Cryobacterium]|uniref:glycosyltransferase family 2 protein n=1 Tax=unclassified Cryobacterium TaxID=2649013 RepID=UPI00106A5012|nr:MULTISPECIES: glycosyltransferase family A protein [unclassified Cryobacterium]TFD09625.1 glycosyltransferase family 2 protein [Cryobacterium sp. TMT1-2-2]TFD10272.1 glycosyltransferase family 2 protein [Cryobacterium sp. TMT1-66-1]
MTTVSVVIPAYNNAEYLEETLASVFAQTFEDFEVIVSDHSSTDSTKAVIEKFRHEPRLVILDTEAGGGALRNWNRVSQAATGTYLKLVCGDDLIHPDILAKQVAAMKSASNVVLVASPRSIVDARNQPVIARRGLAGLRGQMAGARAARATVRSGTNIFGEPACVLIRRDVLERVGWWDSRFPYLIDEATYVRVLLEGDFVAVPEVLAGFRISDSQWSVRLAGQQAQQASDFHRWLKLDHPNVVNGGDVLLGNARAYAMSFARRLAYILLRRRMNRGN